MPVVPAATGGGSGTASNSLIFYDEGVLAGTATVVNVTGTGGTVSVSGGTATLDVSGASGTAQREWALVPHSGGQHALAETVGAANRAIYMPATLQGSGTINAIQIRVGNSSGSISVGLFDSGGVRVATSGGVACPSVGLAEVALTGNYVASPGRYYLGISVDNNTATFSRPNAGGTAGPMTARYQETAHPLPGTATFAGVANPVSIVGLMADGWP